MVYGERVGGQLYCKRSDKVRERVKGLKVYGIKDDKCRKETGKEGKSYLPQEDQGKSLVLLLPKAKKIEVRKTR